MTLDDSASQRSGTSGVSDGSAKKEGVKPLQKRLRPQDGEEDLLEQKRSLRDGVFACMYALTKQKTFSGWRYMMIKVLMEGLMSFLVVFNPAFPAWRIDTSFGLWKVVRWALWRSPIMRLYGYGTYIIIMYVMVGIVFSCVAGVVWLTFAMRKSEQSKWLRLAAKALNLMFDIVFGICYVAFFDYMVFPLNCNFGKAGNMHNYWPDVHCLAMPHLLHMAVAGVTAIAVFLVTGLQLVASCDLNPVSRAWLASPAAYTRLKILCAKALLVVVADCLHSIVKVQTIIMCVAAAAICYWNFVSIPFYRRALNDVWSGMWLGVLYTTVLLAVSAWGEDQSYEAQRALTLDVLYGIFAVVVGGAALQSLHTWWLMRPGLKFQDLPETVKLKKVHKFGSPAQVEVVARCMRQFDTEGAVDEAAANRAELIIKAGMQLFPNTPMLLILYANFLMEVRKDGPASRTQLQIAYKHNPGTVERYQIFCTVENSKRLKDSQEGGMDLQAYVEFKRNYRAVIRVHKEVLAMQCDYWKLLLKGDVRVAEVDRATAGLQEATHRAHQVYKRVLERYPNNGKLLRCYGRFLEDVANDPPAAARAYAEAARVGGSDLILSMNLDVHGAGRPEFLTTMDLNEDAVVVINAEGQILMVNQIMTSMFGYSKSELECSNISLLMPQPFSGRHNGYLQRYTATGEAHILDSVREVIALHKDHFVFPISLCVTKLSGIGADCVFLGVIRPLAASIANMRVWVAPNGIILCADQQFSSVVGILEHDVVGLNITTLATDHDQVQELLERCRDASADELQGGLVRGQLAMMHKYLDPVPCDIHVQMGGTDAQRIFVFSVQRTDGQDGTCLVADARSMAITFATQDVGSLLGHPLRALLKMKLSELLPPPFNALHAKWLKDAPAHVPPTSCRMGQVVHLLSDGGVQVPVRLAIKSREERGNTVYVVQIRKATADESIVDKRVELVVGFDGSVRSARDAHLSVFGFPTRDLVGRSLCDFVDIFEEWRDKQGAGKLQMLMLALLDKDMEMPGASWRVRVHPPLSATGQVVALPSVAGAHPIDHAHAQGPGGLRKGTKPACLQVEVLDEAEQAQEGGFGYGDGDGASAVSVGRQGPCVKVVLWRRELLTGVLELDEHLLIRKANPLMGFIVGLPSASLLKQPLHNYLDIPPDATWASLMASGAARRGGLKGTSKQGVVSVVHDFLGPHIDGGTMRLHVQGVQADASGSKIHVAIHPDITYQGARANLMHVLRLEEGEEGQEQQQHAPGGEAAAAGQHGHSHGHASPQQQPAASHSTLAVQVHGLPPPPKPSRSVRSAPRVESDSRGASEGAPSSGRPSLEQDAGAAGAGAGPGSSPGAGAGAGGSPKSPGGGGGGSGDDERGAVSGGELHRRATNQSEFVASWVTTISKQASGLHNHARGSRQPSKQRDGVGGGTLLAVFESGSDGEITPQVEQHAAQRSPLSKTHADAPPAPPLRATTLFHHAESSAQHVSGANAGSDSDSDAGGGGKGAGKGGAGGAAAAAAAAQGSSDKGSESGESSADASETASSYSGMSGVSAATTDELMVDARRGRLLKALNKLMLGPILVQPLARLRLHTYALLAVMLLTHVLCYIIFTNIVTTAHTNIRLVQSQALAMDRGQLAVVRAMMSAFCARPNITKVHVCSITPQQLSDLMHTSLLEMEDYHQGVYLGFDTVRKLPAGDLYNTWTLADIEFQVFQDTDPPRVLTDKHSLWQLGNAFLAAGRESEHLVPVMQENYRFHRTYSFLVSNGLGPLFHGYARSLDLLVMHAWDVLDNMQTILIVLLAVELGVQLACSVYQWWLVQRVEDARLVGILAMLGLPGPVLRQLASKEAKVADDSDDDDSDADSNAGGDEDQHDHQHDHHHPEGPGAGHAHGHAPGGSGDGHTDHPQGGRRASISSYQGAVLDAPEQGGHGHHERVSTERAAPVAPVLLAEASSHHMAAKRSSSLLSAAQGVVVVNGKTLRRSHWNIAKFMLPLAVWTIALVIIYGVSLGQLRGMQGPLASLNMASRVTYRFTRVRAVAFATVSQDDDEARDYWRAMLADEVRNLESEYDTLMYGGRAITQAGSAFTKEVPASSFASEAFAQRFFKTKTCLRFDPSTCVPPANKYYEVTHNGLDVMMRRIISEMDLLSKDANSALVYDSPRYQVMFYVGTKDVYEGLQQASQLFVDYSISRFTAVTKLHTILLVVMVLLVVCYVLLMLLPHLAQVTDEARRQCGMLSHVPHELDVRSHVRSIAARTNRRRRGRRGAHGNKGGPAAAGDDEEEEENGDGAD